MKRYIYQIRILKIGYRNKLFFWQMRQNCHASYILANYKICFSADIFQTYILWFILRKCLTIPRTCGNHSFLVFQPTVVRFISQRPYYQRCLRYMGGSWIPLSNPVLQIAYKYVKVNYLFSLFGLPFPWIYIHHCNLIISFSVCENAFSAYKIEECKNEVGNQISKNQIVDNI